MMPVDNNCLICGSATIPFYKNLFDARYGYPGDFLIIRCINCGFCRTSPSLTTDELGSVYQEYYPTNNFTASSVKELFCKSLNKNKFGKWTKGEGTQCYSYINPGDRVLDVGCGNCFSLLMAKESGASKAIGLEVDSSIAPIADSLDIDVYIGQLSTLPGEYGTFDVIMASQVLEHEPDPGALISLMVQRLAEKGALVLSFPNVDSVYRRLFKRKWINWHVPYHINHFSKKSVKILAEKNGLSIRMIKTLTPSAWNYYQMHSLFADVAPGQRDTFWYPADKDSQAPQHRSLMSRIGVV